LERRSRDVEAPKVDRFCGSNVSWIGVSCIGDKWITSIPVLLSRAEEHGNVVLKSIVRLRLNGECALSFFEENTEVITATSTTLLAIITGFVAWIAGNQYRTTRAQLRAYLHVDKVQIIHPPDVAPGETGVILYVKNFGSTPASSVEIFVKIQLFTGATKTFSEPVRQPGRSLMAPAQTEHVLEKIDFSITPDVSVDISERRSALYVWGKILYIDAFDTRRFTKFRFLSTGEGFRRNGFETDEEGNEAY